MSFDVEKLKAKGDIKELIKALSYGKDPQVRRSAAIALGEMGQTQAIEPLINALRDTDEGVHKAVFKALKRIGKPAVRYLVKRLRLIREEHSAEFRKSLREEIIHHKDKRASFVLQKLAFTIGLLGAAAIQTEFMGLDSASISSLPEFGWLLYVLPVVALAYDVYIYAEDYKVKRIGTFFRTCDENVSDCEREWEKYANAYREPLAVVASLFLTLITTLPALLLEVSKKGFFTAWWPPLLFTVGCVLIAIFLFFYYRHLIQKLEHGKGS